MEPLRNLIAATDFSADARDAVHRAARIASEHAARLELVHVLEPGGFAALRDWLDTDRDLHAAIAAQAEMELAVLGNALAQDHGIDPARRLRFGSPLQELTAASGQADLLVLGARGSHRLRELTLGTTADRLLRTATRPLLVVKKPPEASYQRVLALVDFSAASQAAVRAAARVAPRARIHLFHSFEVPFEGKLRTAGVDDQQIGGYRAKARQDALAQLALLKDALKAELQHEAAIVVEQGDPRLSFQQAAAGLQPDLVAIGKQGRSFLADVFLGSVTRAVLAEAACDVLVVPGSQG